jgi:SAM-dependent methyltransferase
MIPVRQIWRIRGELLQIKWLETIAGQSLLAQEQQLAGKVLERVFGDHIVQVGNWGAPDLFLTQARTQFSVLLGDQLLPGTGALVAPQRLPVVTDSIDAVLLPHTLELSQEPHAVLREVHRVLRPDGKLIVLGFNPASWWGLRHTFAPTGFPSGLRRQISKRRLSDWLRLLNLNIESVTGCYASASAGKAGKLLRRWQWFASAYVLVATKETIPMTIIRPLVRRRASLVGGLANPSTRNVA